MRQVLKKLLAAKLYVKLSKCEFHQTSLDYLGYRVSNWLSWQPLSTRKQLQSFRGFANFYKQFIQAFAEVALPLMELLKIGGGGTAAEPTTGLVSGLSVSI